MSNNLGNYLKEVRIKKGSSLNQVEEYTGISSSYISRLESGERKVPSIIILSQLATYYKILLEDILEVMGVELESYKLIKQIKDSDKENIDKIIKQIKNTF